MNKDEMGRSFMGSDAPLDPGRDLHRFRGNVKLGIGAILPLEADAPFHDDKDLPRFEGLEVECIAIFCMHLFHLRCSRSRRRNRSIGQKTSLAKNVMEIIRHSAVARIPLIVAPAVQAA